MTRRRNNSYLHHLIERHEHDQVLTVIITAYLTLMLIMLLLAGVAIWPVVFFGAASGSAFAPLCQSVSTCNLLLLITHIFCAAMLLWFDRNFSFTKTALISLALGGFVNLVLLLSQSSRLMSNTGVDFMLTLLWFILSFFLAWVLALLPAALVAGVAKAIHSIFFMLHR